MLGGFRRLGSGLARKVAPRPAVWRGAAWGVLSVALFVWLAEFVPVLAKERSNSAVWLLVGLFTVAVLLVGFFASLLVRWLGSLPPLYRWSFAVGLFPLALVFVMGMTFLGALVVALVAIALGSVAGGSLVAMLRKPRRRWALAGVVLSAIGIAWGAHWFLSEGPRPYVAVEQPTDSPLLDRPDPSQPGAYAVKTLTYGSGADLRRTEYGAVVPEAFRTGSVDGSKLVEGWKGRGGWARTRYWGFDAKHMPLQGRVWYPDGAGPFPLVLMAHGNHSMEEFSDPGYAYLGELLASRGFIAVSVDENFLNFTMGDLLGFPDRWMKDETDGRAWLLLEHLRIWQTWNARAGHPFFGRVDMHQIALMGHSRGGEAVAVAAVFNRLPYYPDNAQIRFDYDFDIRSVIAIAPVDGQYKPAGRPTEPRNVNYFVLQGTEDGDMASFHGSRQLERIKFTGEQYWCKASLYIRGANHGQFNTVWGRHDGDDFLNFSGIMPPDEQRQIAKVTISAFLEATLRGQRDYLTLFQHPLSGQKWLPHTTYRNMFEDSTYRPVASYEEDIDLTTATLHGASLAGENLSDWRERALEISWGKLDTQAVVLGWNKAESNGTSSYTVTLPDPASPPPGAPQKAFSIEKDDVLVFAMADAKEDPTPRSGDAPDKVVDDAPKKVGPIELTVELIGRSGAMRRVPIVLGRQIETNVPKAEFVRPVPNSEVVLQSFEIPVSVPDLKTIRFVFDKTASGVVDLDDIGVRFGKLQGANPINLR